MIEVKFYKDRVKKEIDPKLFSEVAERCAEEIHKSGGKNSNKRTQLRKFYDAIIELNNRVKRNPDDWSNILALVNMVIAKVVYAKGRNNLVSDDFVKLMKNCIAQVEYPEDLDVFAHFFEAFMGFYRQYE